MMRLDRNGAALSASFEALYLFTYGDPATGGEPWTAGIGHTAAAGGIAPRPGQFFTLAQVMAMYRSDMGRVETRVNRAVHVELTQPQFNVECSFDLNTGAIASGSVDDKLNAHQFDAAMATQAQYTKAAGKFMRGLANRRQAEIAIFKTGKYPPMKILVYDRPGAAVRYIGPDALPWDAEPAPVIDVTVPDLRDTSPNVSRTEKENFLLDLLKTIWSWFR